MKHIYLSWHDTEELISKIVFNLNTPYDAVLGRHRWRHHSRRHDRRSASHD